MTVGGPGSGGTGGLPGGGPPAPNTPPSAGVQITQYGHGATTPGTQNQQTPRVDSRGMNDATKALSDLATGIKEISGDLNKALDALTKRTQDVGRDFRDVKGTLKDIVAGVDDMEDGMAALDKVQKGMMKRGIFNRLENIKDLQKQSEAIDDFTKDTLAAMKVIKEKSKGMVDTKETIKALDAASKEFEKLTHEFKQGEKSLSDFEMEWRKVAKTMEVSGGQIRNQWSKTRREAMDEVKKMNREIYDEIQKADRHGLLTAAKRAHAIATVAGGGMKDAGTNMRNRGANFQNTQRAAGESSQAAAQRIKDAFANPGRLRSSLNLGNGGKEGALSKALYGKKYADLGGSGYRAKAIKEAEAAISSGKGYNDLGFRSKATLMGEGSLMKGMGRMFQGSKMGGGILSGLGSMTKLGGMLSGGIGSALGGAAGGLGGMASMAGNLASKAALPLAILKGIADLADATAKMNQAIEDKTSDGGLAHGKVGTIKGYAGMRNMIGTTGDEIALGQTWEKNLDVLKAMIDSGYAMSEDALAGSVNLKQEMDSFKDPSKATGTMMGGVFQAAMFNSRPNGMSQEQTTKMFLELTNEFQQSTSDTLHFLSGVGKASLAAGISTSKYIGIVQNLTGQFDTLNKSFLLATLTIEKMGKSGQYSAKQLQEMSEFMGKGKGFELPFKAALAQEQSPAEKAREIAIRSGQVDASRKELLSSASGLGLDLGDLKDQQTARAQIGQSSLRPEDKKNLTAQLEKLFGEQSQLDLTRRGGVNSAIVRDSMGEDQIGSTMKTIQAMGWLQKKTGLSQKTILEDPSKLPPEAVMAMKQFTGMDLKEMMTNMPRVAGAAGESLANLIPGMDPKRLEGLAKTLNGAGLLGGKNTAASLTDLASKDKPKLIGALAKIPDTLMELITNNKDLSEEMAKIAKADAQKESDAKTRNMEAQTKTTGDIMAKSFEYLFYQIIKPLSALRDWFFKGDADNVKVAQDWVGGLLKDKDKGIALLQEKLGKNPGDDKLKADLATLRSATKDGATTSGDGVRINNILADAGVPGYKRMKVDGKGAAYEDGSPQKQNLPPNYTPPTPTTPAQTPLQSFLGPTAQSRADFNKQYGIQQGLFPGVYNVPDNMLDKVAADPRLAQQGGTLDRGSKTITYNTTIAPAFFSPIQGQPTPTTPATVLDTRAQPVKKEP